MNLDNYHLPMQADGDVQDQLNRVGMIVTAQSLTIWTEDGKYFASVISPLLEAGPGIYKRNVKGNPNNVSVDQMVPVLAFWAVQGNRKELRSAFCAMLVRFGFGQNIHDFTLSASDKWKIPDFMLLRTMPFFTRTQSGFFNTLFRNVFDLYLPIMVVSDWIYYKFGKDPADINCTLVTMVVTTKIHPTLISKFSAWSWKKLRPTIYSDLQRYHRAESGGNPEIAEMYKGLIDEL